MNPILSTIRKLGAELSLVDGKLKISAPDGVLTADLLEEIKKNKDELVSYITLATGRAKFSPIEKAPPKDSYKVSSAQERLYFLHELEPASLVYNMPRVLKIEGVLDKERLGAAFNKLFARHESLRTFFALKDGELVQNIAEPSALPIEHLDARTTGIRQVTQSFVRPFNLHEAPLIRVALAETGEKEHVLLVDMHHIVSDGISRRIFISEFMAAYNGEELPDLKLQYKDYAEWQYSDRQKAEIARQKDFWLKKYVEEPVPLGLPTDFPRPPIKCDAGDIMEFEMDARCTQGLRLIAERTGTTLYMVLLSIYYILLSKLGNQEDIIIGTSTAGRQHADLYDIMGMFVNMLPLRNYPKGGLTFTRFLSQVNDETLACFDNQSFQFKDLVEALEVEKDMSRNPLFEVVFSYDEFEPSELTIGGLTLKAIDDDHNITKFDLRLSSADTGEVLKCNFEYSTALFRRSTIERFVAWFKHIAEQVVLDPDRRLADLQIVTDADRRQILGEFNNTTTVFDRNKTLVDLFGESARTRPGRAAVITRESRYTYEWLNASSNRVAAWLQENGIQREDSVVIIMNRDIEMIVALLAVLKAGGKYIPIEPYLPQNRVNGIARTVSARWIITTSANLLKAGEVRKEADTLHGIVCLSMDGQQNIHAGEYVGDVLRRVDLDRYPPTDPAYCGTSEDLAYVIFTSGSSGEPKGVAVQHRPVINLIEWVNKRFGVGENDLLLFVSSISFDLSVYDIFGVLAAGAAIRIAGEDELEEPSRLARIILQEGITFWDSAPAMLQQVIPYLEKTAGEPREKLRLSFTSGDWIPLNMPVQMKKMFGNLRFIALGGATEATVWSNSYEVEQVDAGWNSIPYGKPIQNSRYLILDKDRNLCPIGVPGDLYIGGECLAREYFNDAALTGKKFIPSPFFAGEMLYDTGDTAKWFPNGDGNIEFLGRKDSQVKIRGYRIELGEIESKLTKMAGISQVLAMVIGKNKFDTFICAYYVAGTAFPEEMLKQFLRKHLPEYMIPKYFIRMEEMPVTRNGKLDRRSLPLPKGTTGGEAVVRPHTQTEQALTTIWANLLHLDEAGISIRDDFFEMGGHSILAVHLINAIYNKFGVEIRLRKTFEYATIERLAEHIEMEKKAQLTGIRGAGEKDFYVLSSAQERLYYDQVLNTATLSYNVSGIYSIKEDVETDRLTDTFQRLIDRHAGLRTSFVLINGEVVQRINPSVNFEMAVLDPARYETAEDLMADFVRPFDLSADSLMRCGIVQHPALGNLLLVDIHHIICDGISLNILMNDFRDIYLGNELAVAGLRYVDYAAWQKDPANGNEMQKRFWMAKLSGELPSLDLPVLRTRDIAGTHSASVKTLTVPGDLYQQIKRFNAGSGISDYMFFLAAYYILLSRISGNADIIIGTDVVGRTHPDLQNIVGTFINELPLRMRINAEDTYADHLAGVKECVLEAFENQDLQLDELISLLNAEGRLSGSLFKVHFAFVNYISPKPESDRLNIVPLNLPFTRTTQYEFKLEVSELNRGFEVSFIYSNTLFDEATIDYFVHYYKSIISSALKDSSIKIDSIEMNTSVIQ